MILAVVLYYHNYAYTSQSISLMKMDMVGNYTDMYLLLYNT